MGGPTPRSDDGKPETRFSGLLRSVFEANASNRSCGSGLRSKSVNHHSTTEGIDMPKDMFQLLVCPPTESTGRWYTVPVSALLHIAFLAVVVVVPLVATDTLPAPQSMLAFITPLQAPSVPPPAPRPRAAAVRELPAASDRFAAPVEAPTGIAPEPAIDLNFDSPMVGDVVGIPGGLGSGDGTFVEAPPAPPSATPQQPIRPGGKVVAPTRTKHVLPVYPRIAQLAKVEGDVLIEAIIGPDGRVREARLLRSISLLDEAALEAVRAWEYSPTLLNGQPVAVIVTVTVRFRLN
jgi:protein TonB